MILILRWLGLVAAGLLGLVAVVLGAAALATLVISLRVAARFPAEGPYVAVTGGRLAYLEAGERDAPRGTVVLLHGASGNAADPMEGVGRRLAAQGFRVLAFDRPGFGWSDRLTGSAMASPGPQGAAIAEALERLGIGPAIVLGHSWAGALAARIALDHPERVSGLVLVAPAALPFPTERVLPWYWRLAALPPVTWLLTRTVAPVLGLYYLPRAGRAVFAPQEPAPDYVERSRAALVLRPGTALANIQDLIGLGPALQEQAPRYPSLRVPTVIVAGEADPIVRTASQAVPLAEMIPGARLVALPGIGHMVQYVAAEALAAEVGRLAERIAAEPPTNGR